MIYNTNTNKTNIMQILQIPRITSAVPYRRIHSTIVSAVFHRATPPTQIAAYNDCDTALANGRDSSHRGHLPENSAYVGEH